MSRILKESKKEAEQLFKLGLISAKKNKKMIVLTARVAKIPQPIQYTGKRIFKIRQQLNCSQKIFADIIGVTPDTISKWERGTRNPDKIACRFLKVLEREGIKAIQ